MKFTARLILVKYLPSLSFALVLTAGCLFRQNIMPTRSFVLTPIPVEQTASEHSGHLPLGIGLVKMPPYLKRTAIAIRKGENEIDYMENAFWAEQLSDLFQRTLASNLAMLVPTDRIYLSSWRREDVTLALYISVEQFDVDTLGTGRLNAWWRIMSPGVDKIIKSGQSRLTINGPALNSNPQVLAKTLSDLSADFSRAMVQAIRESVPTATSVK